MNIRVTGICRTLLAVATLYAAGCAGGGVEVAGLPRATITSTSPANHQTSVPTNTLITATFSKEMEATTFTSASFYASTAAGPLTGTVTFSNTVATLQLSNPLPMNTVVTATITTAVMDNPDNAKPGHLGIGNNFIWTFTTAGIDPPPTVLAVTPLNNAIGVTTGTNVTATFSKAMNPATLNTSTFTLKPNGGVNLAATVAYANGVATLSPSANLTPNTQYTATVNTNAADAAGTLLAQNYVWTFRTGVVIDAAPTVVTVSPLNNATGVSTGTVVNATFSKAMNPATITRSTFTLKPAGGVNLSATVSYANGVATLSPSASLNANTQYTATVNTDVTDTSGTPLAHNFVWSFQTAVVVDQAPTITAISPLNNATQVPVVDPVTVTFNKAMNPTSITTTSFTLTGPGLVAVPATITYANDVATLTPSSSLLTATVYTATVNNTVKDVAGTTLAVGKTWMFTTGQAGINLGSARTYGVLGGSTVTNTGPTNIVGNIGVSPGAAVTGFPPGTLTGTINAGNAVAAQAKADLLVGYADAAGRLNGNALPGSLGGLTLTPGLYTNSSTVMLPVGTSVTFDAQGDSNAVFILQMGSTLTTGVGTSVILTNGALPGNIYWSVGSSATLGVNSSFAGIILASASITANTGATIQGLLLTNVAAVSLESNTVTVPPPSHRKGSPPPKR